MKGLMAGIAAAVLAVGIGGLMGMTAVNKEERQPLRYIDEDGNGVCDYCEDGGVLCRYCAVNGDCELCADGVHYCGGITGKHCYRYTDADANGVCDYSYGNNGGGYCGWKDGGYCGGYGAGYGAGCHGGHYGGHHGR